MRPPVVNGFIQLSHDGFAVTLAALAPAVEIARMAMIYCASDGHAEPVGNQLWVGQHAKHGIRSDIKVESGRYS